MTRCSWFKSNKFSNFRIRTEGYFCQGTPRQCLSGLSLFWSRKNSSDVILKVNCLDDLLWLLKSLCFGLSNYFFFLGPRRSLFFSFQELVARASCNSICLRTRCASFLITLTATQASPIPTTAGTPLAIHFAASEFIDLCFARSRWVAIVVLLTWRTNQKEIVI